MLRQRPEAVRDDDVAGRADRQRDALRSEPVDQAMVLDDGDAVVDSLRAQDVDGDPDVVRTAAHRLARVAGPAEPRPRRLEESRSVRPEVHAKLGGIRADADHPLGPSGPTERRQPLDELEPGGRPVGAVDVGDQHAPDAGLRLGARDAVREPGDDLPEVLAVGKVARGCEEHLAVPQPMAGRVDERLVGDPGPVVAGAEQLLDQPEDGEERVERVVPVQQLRVVDGQAAARPCEPARRPSPIAPCPRRGSAARPWECGRTRRWRRSASSLTSGAAWVAGR